MLGGAYLCYEGAEKVFEAWSRRRTCRTRQSSDASALQTPGRFEDQKVASAIKTDFILSAEIMAITLAAVPERHLLDAGDRPGGRRHRHHRRVYGGVALIVKADDAAWRWRERRLDLAAPLRAIGRGW